MDTELLKSASEEQLDMLLMMQVEKLPPEYSPVSGEYSGDLMMNFAPPAPTVSFSPPSAWQTTAAGDHSAVALPGKRAAAPMAAMREMIFRIAAMQPVQIDPESVRAPKRRNVRISTDPQSVAARHRRERISERIRILQRLVPGGTKMDTASMLDEAIHYMKFLKKQVQTLEQAGACPPAAPMGFPVPMSTASIGGGNYFPMTTKGYYNYHQSGQNNSVYVDSQLTN